MEARIITKPGFDVIGYAIRTRTVDGENNRDIPAFWQRYAQEGMGKRLHDQAASNAEYGICDDFDCQSNEFSYIIGVEAKEDAIVPEGAIRRRYPERMYAVFTTPKAAPEQYVQSIQDTWAAIFRDWLPNSNYEHTAAPEFEYYDERSCSERNELLEMDIYIPVKAKA
ncbi:GyrI-like domain-containing protein [Paenibacillus sp. J5C_2022]|uniref:GyrI-like domain-containing protein n=1 Tax=Paenibacillus sp. J5C2022 TaxID=2977129 RepID=UPI0021CF30AA|nr:GyrI-like domain-containing protein [Paenibacillus sp. J5C2022]MCU6712088.1 GyrI-like domain-containing protein [Paenibacillus sp. J5C2022]